MSRAFVLAVAFHEAGHAVTALALEHIVNWIRVEPRPGGRQPGLTCRTVAGPGERHLFLEESAIVSAIGGLAEMRHNPAWTPDACFRDDDLQDTRERLRNTGSGEKEIETFVARCDEIADRLLGDPLLWAGIAAVASHVASEVSDKPVRVMRAGIENALYGAVSRAEIVGRGPAIRRYCPELHSIRGKALADG